jgi:hypothetical protein
MRKAVGRMATWNRFAFREVRGVCWVDDTVFPLCTIIIFYGGYGYRGNRKVIGGIKFKITEIREPRYRPLRQR